MEKTSSNIDSEKKQFESFFFVKRFAREEEEEEEKKTQGAAIEQTPARLMMHRLSISIGLQTGRGGRRRTMSSREKELLPYIYIYIYDDDDEVRGRFFFGRTRLIVSAPAH